MRWYRATARVFRAQVRQLTKAGCKKVFREIASGAKTDRAQLRRLLDVLDARARTGEGRARAVARGQKMGRPPKLTPHQQKEAIKRRDQGDETLADIGRSYNVSAATISRL
jgi:DNA invertase Pin-like site-specific DNA recombinase